MRASSCATGTVAELRDLDAAPAVVEEEARGAAGAAVAEEGVVATTAISHCSCSIVSPLLSEVATGIITTSAVGGCPLLELDIRRLSCQAPQQLGIS